MKNIIVFKQNNPMQAVDPQVNRLFPHMAKFASLLQCANKILLKTSAVFPFDLFPDEIIIDENKVSIVFREFFLSEDIHSISIDMIRDIEVETGPIFATLRIVPDGFPTEPITIKFLKKSDAILARQIIQGLITMRREGISPAKLDMPDMANKIAEMGGAHVVE